MNVIVEFDSCHSSRIANNVISKADLFLLKIRIIPGNDDSHCKGWNRALILLNKNCYQNGNITS
jgi:hypothetical protein